MVRIKTQPIVIKPGQHVPEHIAEFLAGAQGNAPELLEAKKEPVMSQSWRSKMHENHHLPVGKLRLDGGTQPRLQMSEALIDEYAEQMLAGDKFEAIEVFFDGKDYWVADGFHRVLAAQKAGIPTLYARVISGTQEEAWLYSRGANSKHGWRRNNADKRAAVESVLRREQYVQWTDERIADICAVDPKTVARVRGELVASLEIPEIEERVAVRDGKEYTVKTSKIGGKPADTKPVSVIEYNHMGHQTYAIDIDAKTVNRAKSGHSWEPIYYAIEDHVRGEESVLVFARYDGGFPNQAYVACRDSAVHAATATERIVETDIMVAVALHPIVAFSDYEFHTEGAIRRIVEAGHVVVVFDAEKTLGNLRTVQDAMERQKQALEHVRLEEQRRAEEAQEAVRRSNSLIEHPADPDAQREAARAAIFGETPLSTEGHPIPGLPLPSVNLLDDPEFAARAAEHIDRGAQLFSSIGLSQKASQLSLESVAGIPGFMVEIFVSQLDLFAKAYLKQTGAKPSSNGNGSPSVHQIHLKIDEHFSGRYAITEATTSGVRNGYHRHFVSVDDPAIAFRVQYLIAERKHGQAQEYVWLELADKKLKTQAEWLAVLAPESGALHLIKTKRLVQWLEQFGEFRDRDERNGRVGILVQLEDVASFAQVEEVAL